MEFLHCTCFYSSWVLPWNLNNQEHLKYFVHVDCVVTNIAESKDHDIPADTKNNRLITVTSCSNSFLTNGCMFSCNSTTFQKYLFELFTVF